jgi:capsular polysaccharide transport system permease protein
MLTKTTLKQSLIIQGRVVGALLMREILTRYGRHNIGFLWLFVEPMLFTLGVTALWTATRSTHGSNLPIVAFAITGYSSVLLWRNAANRCCGAIEPNLSLLYHRNVRVMDLFAARLLLEIAGATISLLILSTFFISIGWMNQPEDIWTMLVGWLLLTWFAISLALVVGSLSERSESFDRVWHTITYLLFPLSGAGFMVDWLPKAAQDAILWLPMVHGTEMLRHGYFGTIVHTYEQPSYLLLANIVLMLFGLSMLRETGRRMAPE